MAQSQINALLEDDEEFQDRELELLPENITAFYWFLDVDDLWIYTQGIRVALDVSAVLADATASERKYTKQDYQKLRILSRHVVSILSERASEQK